jgi:hypothetical protein
MRVPYARHVYRVELQPRVEWRTSKAAGRLRAFTRANGWSVLDGPSRGLRYSRMSGGVVNDLGAKLAGTYESCLHEVLEAAIAAEPALVINIGSAEGYYAVGLALRLPAAQVVAVDTSDVARVLCRRLARGNRVDQRVTVLPSLSNSIPPHQGRPLFIFDCEGAERELLDPVAIPALEGANILAEMHEFVDPRMVPICADRFRATHLVQIIDEIPPDASVAALRHLSEPDRAALLDEQRPGPMRWLWMTAT